MQAGKKIEIKVAGLNIDAHLNDTTLARKIFAALPISGKVTTWGDEIYFTIPLELKVQEPKDIVSYGDIGYWPLGKALCLFFGPTPISSGNEIRPASPVDVIGKIEGDPALLKRAKEGEKIEIYRGE